MSSVRVGGGSSSSSSALAGSKQQAQPSRRQSGEKYGGAASELSALLAAVQVGHAPAPYLPPLLTLMENRRAYNRQLARS